MSVTSVFKITTGGQPIEREYQSINKGRGEERVKNVAELQPGLASEQDIVTELEASRIRQVDPMILWDAWPGEEPIEELMAGLRDSD